jgi:Flp pilus assembly protein TadB
VRKPVVTHFRGMLLISVIGSKIENKFPITSVYFVDFDFFCVCLKTQLKNGMTISKVLKNKVA